MSTHNIGFYEDLTKLSLNYYPIISNTHLISSAVGIPDSEPPVQPHLKILNPSDIGTTRSIIV